MARIGIRRPFWSLPIGSFGRLRRGGVRGRSCGGERCVLAGAAERSIALRPAPAPAPHTMPKPAAPAAGRNAPKDSAAASKRSSPAAVSSRPGCLSTFRTLPIFCRGLLACVALDLCLMLWYSALLLATGSNASASYLGIAILVAAVAMGYFSISSLLRENTVEMLAALAVGTSVTLFVYYVNLGGDVIDEHVSRDAFYGNASSLRDNIPDSVRLALTLGWQGLVQLGLVFFGYYSYRDFGWRMFKLFGADLRLRDVYETQLWCHALLKIDLCCSVLNVVSGFAFFFDHLSSTLEELAMWVGIIANLAWLIGAFFALRLESRFAVLLLLLPGLLPPAYLLYKATFFLVSLQPHFSHISHTHSPYISHENSKSIRRTTSTTRSTGARTRSTRASTRTCGRLRSARPSPSPWRRGSACSSSSRASGARSARACAASPGSARGRPSSPRRSSARSGPSTPPRSSGS